MLLTNSTAQEIDVAAFIKRLDGIWTEDKREGECEAVYKAGGGEVNISPIPPTTIAAPTSTLAKVATLAAGSANLGMHSTNAIKAFVGAWEKLAPKLASSLGIFGAFLGFVAFGANPTAGEMMKEVEKAIDKLASEVDRRLLGMQDYVDHAVIQSMQRLTNNRFKTFPRAWARCLNNRNKRRIEECEQDTEWLLSSALNEFAIYFDEMDQYPVPAIDQQISNYVINNPEQVPSKTVVKELEASLAIFREYATLHLLVLQTLLNRYEEDDSSCGRFEYRKYTKILGSSAVKYEKYALWAYKWIFIRQYAENVVQPGYHARVSFKITKENDVKHVGHGQFQYSSLSGQSKIRCTMMLNDNECRLDGTLDFKGSDTFVMDDFVQLYKVGLQHLSDFKAKQLCQTYMNQLKKDMENDWSAQLLKSVTVWKETGEKATAANEALPPESDSSEECETRSNSEEPTDGNGEREDVLSIKEQKEEREKSDKDMELFEKQIGKLKIAMKQDLKDLKQAEKSLATRLKELNIEEDMEDTKEDTKEEKEAGKKKEDDKEED